MKIVRHWLEADQPSEKIRIQKSPHAGPLIDPDFLVIHYTATDDSLSAVNWFMNTSSNMDRIAAHIVLDPDGTIIQMVPFNQRANHAGASSWNGVDFFNSHSVGIEIVNPGFAEKTSNGGYRRPIGKDKNTGNPIYKSYPAGSPFVKTFHKHKFWTAKDNLHWHLFPAAQLKSLYTLSKTIFETYQMVNALGHDDISPARKPDPGPAFPWDEFKTKVFGITNPVGNIYRVKEPTVNMRMEPTTNSPVMRKLGKGYEVGLVGTYGQWSKVYLVDKPSDVLQKFGRETRSIKIMGWIFSTLLEPKT
jgi:N-acetylmuramoyl-L-alanine amidase